MLHFFLSEGMTMRSQAKWLGSKLRDIQRFIEDLFEGDLHAKRVYSLANATLGVMTSASLAVSVIGQALAQARGLLTKHAVKQVDRLLSNPGVVVWDCFAYWVPQVVGARKAIVVAMDWTDFEGDKQTTLVLSLVTRHGRATPLLWLTVDKATLKDRRNEYEDRCLSRFAEVLPAGTEVTILADRGFGDQKLFAFLTALGFAYVIRFRGNITVTDAQGESRSAADWVGVGGRAHTLRGAKVTADEYPVGTVVCVHAKAMKEPWCLAASDPQGQTRTLINYYGKRWAIESSFRDTKDLRFGMGLGALHIASPERRDRLLLINAFAIVLLTLLGAAGESLGMDRHLKANTVKRRTHSLFRQGCMLYDLIPTMLEERLRPLIQRFSQLLLQHRAFSETFCVV
jgi:hypothetical protein